jgi:hypothetical protein
MLKFRCTIRFYPPLKGGWDKTFKGLEIRCPCKIGEEIIHCSIINKNNLELSPGKKYDLDIEFIDNPSMRKLLHRGLKLFMYPAGKDIAEIILL